MQRAETDGYGSIAFPAVGCGKIGASASLVAQSMVQAARPQGLKSGISVSFIIQTGKQNVHDEFQKEIAAPVPTSVAPAAQPVSKTIGNAKIEVVLGDITTQQVYWSLRNVRVTGTYVSYLAFD